MELRPYQQEALDAIFDYWRRGGGNPLVDLATGTGKSVVIAKLVRQVVEQFPDIRVVMLVHVKELVEQNAKALLRAWPQAPIGINSAGLGRRDKRSQILFASIQSVAKEDATTLGPRHLILVDESHLIPRAGSGMYQTFIGRMREAVPDLRVAGFTATPFRLDSGRMDEGEDRLFDETVYSYDIGRGVDDGYLSPLVSRATGAVIDVTNVARRGGEFVAGDLERAANVDAVTQAACDEIVAKGADRRSWLMFCAGVEHAEAVATALRARGVSVACVTGQTPRAERDRMIRDFREGRLRALTNANVLTTGFDAPRLDLIAMLRPTLSTSLYCLDSETEILTSHGWKSIGHIHEGDAALAMNMKTGAGEWSRVVGVVLRPMNPSEQWVSYDAPRANFRVTGNHKMIFATQTREGWTNWKLGEAIDMAQFKDGVRMPTAVSFNSPGIPLSDAELYLIGIVMTDGSISSHQVTIYQSERHPEIMEAIESALAACNIAYSKTRIKATTQYEERFPRWRYSISAGDPKGGKPGKGFRYLYPFLDKDLSPALLTLSRTQFFSLLRGMWDGDGSKTAKAPSCDWTPRSWQLCSARKIAIERLQALAAMHGCTAHLRWEHKGRTNPIGIITISDQNWRNVGGSGNRPQITISDATNEDVWCIETEAGTIVTRRRGKVTVMGNCQMLGRGTRLADGKSNCLVLDFAQNVRRHGPVDAVRVSGGKGAGDGKVTVESVQAKECPNCESLVSIRSYECPHCGHEWERPAAPKHQAKAEDEAPVMSREMIDRWLPVTHVAAFPHHKAGSPPSMRVEYTTGLTVYREWITCEHPGFAGAKASKWWRSVVGTPAPATTKEALGRAGEIKVSAITVRRDGKFWAVVSRRACRSDGRLIQVDEKLNATSVALQLVEAAE